MTSFVLALSVLDSCLKLAVIAAEKMDETQFQAFITRHEERIAWIEGIVKKLTPAA